MGLGACGASGFQRVRQKVCSYGVALPPAYGPTRTDFHHKRQGLHPGQMETCVNSEPHSRWAQSGMNCRLTRSSGPLPFGDRAPPLEAMQWQPKSWIASIPGRFSQAEIRCQKKCTLTIALSLFRNIRRSSVIQPQVDRNICLVISIQVGIARVPDIGNLGAHGHALAQCPGCT